MNRKLMVVLALVLALTFVLAACQPADKPATEAPGGTTEAGGATEAPGGDATEAPPATGDNPAKARANADNTIVVGMAATKGVFNPIYYSTAYDGYVVELVFDTLFSNDDKGEYTPNVAKSWDISDDNLNITFHLRDDVKFSDGTPLTAKDVVFTYQAMADPSYTGRYSYIVDKLVGTDEYRGGAAATEAPETTEEATEEATEPAPAGEAPEFKGVTMEDDYTVTFHFKEANATNFGDCGMSIMPSHYYAYEYGDVTPLTQLDDKPMGSGAYMLTEIAPEEYVALKANADYFLGAPKIENMILRFTQKDTVLASFQSGDFDALDSLENSPENREVAEGMSSFAELIRYDNNGYAYIGLNMTNPSLAKKEVRQALAYGFDRQAFVEDFFEGAAVVPNVPFARVSWVYTDEMEEALNKYEYNPEKAIQLLEEAGYTEVDAEGIRSDGTNKLEFGFETYSDTAWTEQLVSILTEEWKAIGVKINENFQEFNGMTTKVYTDRDFDMYTMAWSLVIDPSPRGIFHSENIGPDKNNSVQFNNAESDRLIEAAEATFDQAERQKLYKDWGVIWNDELPYIPVYMRENWQLVNNRVKGWDTSPYVSWRNSDVLLNLELVD